MFTSCDVLYHMERKRRRQYHCIQIEWEGLDPRVVVYDRESNETCTLEIGDNLDLLVSGRRACVGRFGGGYSPCGRGSKVTNVPQCDGCYEPAIPNPSCIFEPRCDGSLCDSPPCRAQHVVYVAFYGGTPKVGMSSKGRVSVRIAEQGADAYSVVATAGNRMDARELERGISAGAGINQSVRNRDILHSLIKGQARDEITEAFQDVTSRLERLGREGVEPGPLRFLEYPGMRGEIASQPSLEMTPGVHRGEVLGVKGSYLMYLDDGPRALSLPDLCGRYIRT